ncbi:protein Mpv17-like [Homalodisca vitripennis]|uniref:protein Mpv17-like n=1 Tax=Homalodisca vitripennis TaxID=197043 RepID=UPI001EECB8A0|nr:protein Mpv17-like [Homalodisca vitripennis]
MCSLRKHWFIHRANSRNLVSCPCEYQFGSGGVKILFKKIACDQLLFAPFFLVVGCLMCTIDTLKGKSVQETKEDLKNNYPEILLSNYKVWPFVQVVNSTLSLFTSVSCSCR